MGKKKMNEDEDDYLPLSPDFPPIPPPAPEGGWVEPIRMKIGNVHDPPETGRFAPFPEEPIDIRRLDLRVGKITFAMAHPSNPASLVLTYINVGDPFPKPVVSEIGKFYKKQDLEGRMVVAMCNLEPLEMKNIGNSAMLMCASVPDNDGGFQYELWNPPAKSKVGEEVHCEEYPIMAELMYAPHLPFMRRREKIFEQVAADIKVNSEREVVYKDNHRLFVKRREGFVTTSTLANCPIKMNPV